MSDADEGYSSLQFTRRFLESLVKRGFSASELSRIFRALDTLERDERYPSLRVHQMEGEFKGIWSASASAELRITFERLEGGRKRLLDCSRHYRR